MKGYISEEHKRRFTITAGILGVIFFIAQFILPYIGMLIIMPAMRAFDSDSRKSNRMGNSVFWQEQIWYVEESSGGMGTKEENKLKVFRVGSKEKPFSKLKISAKNPLLLAGQDRLWIISSSSLSYYDGDKLDSVSTTRHLGDISSPFMYKGNPAVIERTPASLNLEVFDGNDWIKERALISSIHDTLYFDGEIKIISQGGEICSFLKFGKTLYYREGIPSDSEEDLKLWQSICLVETNWYPVFIGKEPAVFTHLGSEVFAAGLEGFRLSNGNKWVNFFSYDIPHISEISVHSLDDSRFIILTQAFSGPFKAIEVTESEVSEEIRYEESSFFPARMMQLMYIPYAFMFLAPLILALILSGLMQKYRIVEYEEDGATVRFAPLAKRAFAQIVDGAIVVAPWIIGFFMMMRTLFGFENYLNATCPFGMLAGFGFILAGFGWALICLFVFSWTEGKYGRTPGKSLFRIKVLGTELAPCGFGRAFIRNLLTPVDGFFNFMVGVMLIALSDNWQRIGDLAARTIVVEDRK